MAETKLTNMIDPEVMASMISATLPNKIKFAPLAKIDTTLAGRPGSTLTVPKFAYIGPAEDVAEGVSIGITTLTTSDTDFTIKKAAKAVEITDEAVLSGLGNPIGEATNQLQMSIADKIDEDLVTCLEGATLVHNDPGTFDLDTVANGLDLFTDEDDETKVMVMHPSDASVLRKSVAGAWQRYTDLGDSIVVNGTYGAVLDAQVVRSRRVTRGLAHIVKPGALTIFMKRGAQVETDRDILAKSTVISADEHYGTYLYDESKAVTLDVRTTVTLTVTTNADVAVADATVTFGGMTGTTNASGIAVFKIIGGSYTAVATKGADTKSATFTVVDGTAKAQTIKFDA
jgi:hypothetical protein